MSRPSAAPPAEKIGEHRYRIGQVTVDTAARTAQVPCRVNMQKGMIEYLAVASEGKLHESALRVDAEPLHLHLALLLLGLDLGPRPRYQGDPTTPFSAPPPDGSKGTEEGGSASGQSSWVEARVEWRQGGRERSARLEEWAWDIPARRPMAPVAWLFTGASPPGPGPVLMEQRSIVATYRDPDAVLNNPLPTGGDDTVYKVNERVVPPVGTPVTLVLTPVSPKQHQDTGTRRSSGASEQSGSGGKPRL